VKFINAHRERWGIEPICATLQVAPSTYYAATSRHPSARNVSDERLKVEIARVHRANFGVYGIEKVWRQLNREGVKIGRDRVARLMDGLALSGVVRGKKKRTTVPAEAIQRPADLVERNFTAAAPNAVWVADRTYVSTWSGFAYVAFVVDVFSRYIVGWRVSNSLHADLASSRVPLHVHTIEKCVSCGRRRTGHAAWRRHGHGGGRVCGDNPRWRAARSPQRRKRCGPCGDRRATFLTDATTYPAGTPRTDR
jgi:putative transposase